MVVRGKSLVMVVRGRDRVMVVEELGQPLEVVVGEVLAVVQKPDTDVTVSVWLHGKLPMVVMGLRFNSLFAPQKHSKHMWSQ